MISEGRLTYMTYPEPWGGPPKQPPEFLRPAPKPLPQTSRYNGVTINTSLNGTRLGPPQRPPSKYPSPPAATPVNLTQPKDEVTEELPFSAYNRHFPPPPAFYHPTVHFGTLYQSPYTPIIRTNYAPPPPLSPLEPPYTPTTPSATNTATFLSPPATFSPPASLQQQPLQQTVVRAERKPSPSFKVPSGKEGSLKHRILTRPGDSSATLSRLPQPLDLQQTSTAAAALSAAIATATDGFKLSESTRKRLTATVSPPSSPAKPGNNVPVGKHCVIKLENGEYRKMEDMRTEDFINCCEHSPNLRLAESTVVKIDENSPGSGGICTVTLSYNQRRNQVEYEAPLEYPYFVYGQGWASCSPEKTQQIYGMRTVHRLQVGDIVISMTPREPAPPPTSVRGSTIITTATTTAVTARQLASTSKHHLSAEQQLANLQSYHLINSAGQHLVKQHINPVTSSQHLSTVSVHHAVVSQHQHHQQQHQQQNHPPQSSSPDCISSKKRRWSAPDQICDEDEQKVKKVKT